MMRYLALATDYDGTLAHDGRVDRPTLAALERVRASGRKLLLVTGRELPDLATVFPHLKLFDRVVAENGAVLVDPASKAARVLAEPPPEPFLALLRQRGVAPLSVGQAIVATWRPHETALLEAIRDLGLEMQVIFNKDAVMVLPSGVNKATGLTAALTELGLSPHNVVGVGDAENDHAFLELCECSAAVANALPMVRARADIDTKADHGAGVVELIDELLDDDLARREGQLTRHHVLLGTRADGAEVRLPPYGPALLVAGSSGGGKSTLATGLLERLAERKYQLCVVDPEGDYAEFEGVVALGDPEHAPTVEEALTVLEKPDANLVVGLVGLPLAERPPFFQALLARLLELRGRTGRPHWLVVDEAHHLLPAAWEPSRVTLPTELHSVLYITVHPDLMAPAVLRTIDRVVAMGETPAETLHAFAHAAGAVRPEVGTVPAGRVLLWDRRDGAPVPVKVVPGKSVRRRHTRKYATGELPPERSFYFRGPEGKLNLRAQNLFIFLQLADGVDDATWEYHRKRGGYSEWFRERIKDDALADEAVALERDGSLSPAAGRARMRELVEARYTLPATPPMPMPGTDAAAVHT
jgi:hydroxymethylpyrimidine pyrophosphatase-like HAD family hydrolase